MPLKIAPVTKYGPKMVLCQSGATAMEKIPRDHRVDRNRDGEDHTRHAVHGPFQRTPLAVASGPADREPPGQTAAPSRCVLRQLRQIRNQRQI